MIDQNDTNDRQSTLSVLDEWLLAARDSGHDQWLHQPKRAFVIYGAGVRGRQARRVLEARGHTVLGFLDRAAINSARVDDLPCHTPDDCPQVWRAATIIIAVFNPEADTFAIETFLRELGFADVVSFFAFHRAFANELGDIYWLTQPSFYQSHRGAILAAHELWHDETSRAIFRGALRLRLLGDVEAMNAPSLDDQYCPHDLPRWACTSHFVDCGAFEGEVPRQLARHSYAVESASLFEPDAQNLARLGESLRAADPLSRASVWPCAVWSQTQMLRFSGGSGASSHLADEKSDGGENAVFIAGVALDDALPLGRVDLIKMDIEGAEAEALRGARRLIERNRPGLAICAYHKPEHLWALALELNDWDLNYHFALRAHRFNGFDLVLYAAPA